MARNSQPSAVFFDDPRERNGMRHVGGGVLEGPLVANQKQRRLDFESIIPTGVVAQTANGTSRDVGTGSNYDPPYSWGQVEPKLVWPAGRSNRTGE